MRTLELMKKEHYIKIQQNDYGVRVLYSTADHCKESIRISFSLIAENNCIINCLSGLSLKFIFKEKYNV